MILFENLFLSQNLEKYRRIHACSTDNVFFVKGFMCGFSGFRF